MEYSDCLPQHKTPPKSLFYHFIQFRKYVETTRQLRQLLWGEGGGGAAYLRVAKLNIIIF